jgi:hypothetical protein
MEIWSALITASASILTAIIILQLQNLFSKKKIFKALYGEVESNLSLAQKILPLAEHFTQKKEKEKHLGTYFDLQRLYTYSYEDFRRAGYLLSLDSKTRELLEEVYELIFSHNYQTERIRSREIDLSSYEASILSLIPPIGGYSERLKRLIEKLKLLEQELKPYI